MSGSGFVTLVCFCYTLVSCYGEIISPAEGTEYIFLPGSTGNITWGFDNSVRSLHYRSWHFKRSGSTSKEILANIHNDNDPEIQSSSLSGIEIEKPATLILKNVNQNYDGVYQFTAVGTKDSDTVRVRVFIAAKPNVTLNCSSLITTNEGDDVTCVCRDEGGNPPADLTWYKNGYPFSGKGTGSMTLRLSNVDESANGNYTCLAQSSFPKYTDNGTLVVRLRVNFKPKKTYIKFSQNPAVLDTSVTITCESRGFPEPIYTITVNATIIVAYGSERIRTIGKVKWNDTGLYCCTTSNELGSDLDFEFLRVTEQVPTTSKNGPSHPSPNPISNNCMPTLANKEPGHRNTSTILLLVLLPALSLLLAFVIGYSMNRYWRKIKDREKGNTMTPRSAEQIEMEKEKQY